jgi:hypothetical protein
VGTPRKNILLPERVTGEERKRALEEPGPSWKEWAYATGLKPYVALGLLVLDGLLLASIEEAPQLWVRWSALVALPFLIYANYYLYAYLWASPPETPELRKARAKPSVRHPFYVGRWHPRRAKALEEQKAFLDHGAQVAPEEFL